MSNPKTNWHGYSGRTYEFEIFSVNQEFNPNIDGNYIFARQTSDRWEAVYIGEGDIKTRTEVHKREGCVLRKGATHIHAHSNNSEDLRKSEESDLLGYNSEAYDPSGCNIKHGG